MTVIDLYNEDEQDTVNTPIVNTININISGNINASYIQSNQLLETDASSNIIGRSLGANQIVQGTVSGALTSTDKPTFGEVSLQDLFKTTIAPSNTTVDTLITLPDPGKTTSNIVITDTALNATQTINSPLTLSNTLTTQNSVELGALTPHATLYLNASKNIVPATLNNGQLLIGSTGADPIAANITSTGGSISITNTAGGINLETASTDAFTSISLSANTNQIAFTHSGIATSTLNVIQPSANRAISLDDPGANASIVMTENSGTQLINGIKSFKKRIEIGTLSDITNTNAILNKFMASGGEYSLIATDTPSTLTYNLPDTAFNGGSSSANFIMSEGNRTLNNISVFTDTIIANAGASSSYTLLKLQNNGASTYKSITSTTPSASLTLNIPDPGTSSSFILADGPSQSINIITNQSLSLKGDSTASAPSQLLIKDSTATKLMSMGQDTTNNIGSLAYYNGTSQSSSILGLQKNGGNVTMGGKLYINNVNGYTTPTSASGNNACIIYGSGSTDTTSDVLQICQNTNTNPYTMTLGINLTSGYGVIDCLQQGTTYKDIHFNPGGSGVTYFTNGIGVPKDGTLGNFTTLNRLEIATSATWSSSGAYVGNWTVSISKIANIVTISFPHISGTSAASTTINFAAGTIPSQYRPFQDTRMIIDGSFNGLNQPSCLCYITNGGAITFFNTITSSNTGGAFSSGFTFDIFSFAIVFTTS